MLVRLQCNLDFLHRFSKNAQKSISRQSIQWKKSCSTRTDRQTDVTKLMIALRNYANAPKNGCITGKTLMPTEQYL
jgi:hypothetical protein